MAASDYGRPLLKTRGGSDESFGVVRRAAIKAAAKSEGPQCAAAQAYLAADPSDSRSPLYEAHVYVTQTLDWARNTPGPQIS